MRILSVIAFVMMALGSMGALAQTVGTGTNGPQRAAQKTACERMPD